MSAIGLGAWQFGSREWGYGSHYAEHDAVDIVNRALDLGHQPDRHGRDLRLSAAPSGSSVGPSRSAARRCSCLEGGFPSCRCAAFVAQRAAGSCRRLGVAQIDLYQLHQPNPVVPLTEQMAAMRALQRSGVIRQIGVSNYSLDRWQAAEGALGGPVLSNQVRFNLVDRRPLEGMTEWAHGQRPRGDRLQPARPGPAVRAL